MEWWQVLGFCLYFEDRANRFAGVRDDSKLVVRTTEGLEWSTADLRKTLEGGNLDLG